MIISIVAALGRNNVIGNENKLPWRLPADMKRFVALTKGKTVVMGRRTYESIGKPLPDRENIVMSRDKNYRAEGCIVVHSVDEALQKSKGKEVMVIGGAGVYKNFLPVAKRLYLTLIDEAFEGDTYFPGYKESDFVEKEREYHERDEKNQHNYTFITLERKE